MTTTDSWQEVEEALLGPEPDYDEDPDALDLIDRGQADRLVRRIAKLDASHELETAAVQAQIDELQRFLERRYETYSAQRAWLSARLRRFHEALLAADPRLKTVKLPAGELRMRVQQPAVTVDGETFIPWAVEHRPDTLREVPATVAVDLRTVRAALVNGFLVDADGEQAPGVTVEEREPKFSIEPAEREPEPVSPREQPAERIVGVNWHSAACVDDEGKVECCCGLDDLRERAAEMHAEPPDDGEAYAQFQADQYDPGPDDGPSGDPF